MHRGCWSCISGVHGVEGFCGSAIQTGMLRLMAHAAHARGHGGAARARGQPLRLFASASRDAGEHRPQPQLRRLLAALCRSMRGYAEIHDLLLPAQWPPHGRGRSRTRSLPRAPRRARPATGDEPGPAQPSPTACSSAAMGRPGATTPSAASCGATRAQVRQLASIDIHTGLGPYGVGERIFASFDEDPARAARAASAGGAN